MYCRIRSCDRPVCWYLLNWFPNVRSIRCCGPAKMYYTANCCSGSIESGQWYSIPSNNCHIRIAEMTKTCIMTYSGDVIKCLADAIIFCLSKNQCDEGRIPYAIIQTNTELLKMLKSIISIRTDLIILHKVLRTSMYKRSNHNF